MLPSRLKSSVDLAPKRVEILIPFDLMPIAKPDFWTEVRRSCVRCSTVFSRNRSSWHPVSGLRGLWEVRQGQSEASVMISATRLAINFFFSCRYIAICMDGQENFAMGSPVIENLANGVPRNCTVWQRIPLSEANRDLLLLEQQRWAFVWTIVFCSLKVVFGCASTELSIQFSTWSFPNWIEYSVC